MRKKAVSKNNPKSWQTINRPRAPSGTHEQKPGRPEHWDKNAGISFILQISRHKVTEKIRYEGTVPHLHQHVKVSHRRRCVSAPVPCLSDGKWTRGRCWQHAAQCTALTCCIFAILLYLNSLCPLSLCNHNDPQNFLQSWIYAMLLQLNTSLLLCKTETASSKYNNELFSVTA